jgi:hypothetical protein
MQSSLGFTVVAYYSYFLITCHSLFLLFQRSSVSPAEREKYRSRSPDVEPDLKRRKEDKLGGHVSLPALFEHC